MEDNIYKLLNKIETDTSIYEEHDLSEHEKKRLKEGLHRKIGASGEKKVKGNRHIKAAAIAAICVLVGGGIATALILGNEKKDENINEEYVQNATILEKEDVTVQEEISSRRYEEFTDVNGDVKIRVDIDLVEEDIKMPVVQVECCEISDEDIKKWEEVFFGENAVTEQEGNSKYERKYAANGVNGLEAVIGICNRDEADFKVHSMYFYYLDSKKVYQKYPYKSITLDEAKIIGDQLIDKLGIQDNWMFYESDSYDDGKDQCVHNLRYCFCVDGTPVVPLWLSYLTNDEGLRKIYHSEIQIQVINGEVLGVSLDTPLLKKEVLEEGAKIIHADEAYDIFKEQAQTCFSRESVCDTENPAYGEIRCCVRCDDVSIALAMVGDKENKGAYDLVPAWVFYGYMYYPVQDADIYTGDHQDQDLDTYTGQNASSEPLIIINALDGSVISPDMGD